MAQGVGVGMLDKSYRRVHTGLKLVPSLGLFLSILMLDPFSV